MNGPLKIESDTDLDTLEAIKTTFIAFLNDATHKREHIKIELAKIKMSYESSLGCYAEFWLLLALGTEIADPRHVYGGMAATYRSIASQRTGFSDEIQIEYLTQSFEQHMKRAKCSNAQINPDLKNRYRIAANHANYRLSLLQPETRTD